MEIVLAETYFLMVWSKDNMIFLGQPDSKLAFKNFFLCEFIIMSVLNALDVVNV